ncbi:hypothetical protein GCM10027299_49440 [Larkinella ripae]
MSRTGFAQITKHFDKSIGGTGDDLGQVVLATPDGGYILGGLSDSGATGTKTDTARRSWDYWVVKYSANHQKQWDKTFGGTAIDYFTAMIATSDGGFLLGGHSNSTISGEKSDMNRGTIDYWVVKIDSLGNKQWDKTFGGSDFDYLYALAEVPEGKGYLLTGNSSSPASGDKSQNGKGNLDYWVVRIDASGQKLWDKTLGGNDHDECRAILATAQGGALLMGYTSSTNNEDIQDTLRGDSDYWLIQLDSQGVRQWDVTLGGNSKDVLTTATPTPDGGFLLGGISNSGIGGDKSEINQGENDYWVVKIDALGRKQWDRTLGGSGQDYCFSVLATQDNGYLIGGYSESGQSGTKTQGSQGITDYWVVKLGADGTLQEDKTVGGSGHDLLFSLAQTTQGEYLLLGQSNATGGDRTEPYQGQFDYWLVALHECRFPSLHSNVTTLPLLPNTLGVTLTVKGCEGGSITWAGLTATTATIPVSTSAPGSFVYSVTCTQGSCTGTASHTVTISPPLVTGSFDGFVYGADCSTFRGWAWDRSKPNAPFSIQILDGPNHVGTIMADQFRQDLQTGGKGNGKHAFSFPIPASLKDGLPHKLSARIEGSSFILKDSPKALICEGVPVPGGNKPPLPPSPTILIAPLAAQVGVPFSGTLVPFTDPEGQPLTYKLSGLPGGLLINETSRVITGTPSEAGAFVLTYQATDPGPLTNSVSFPLTVNPASTTTVTGSFEGYLDKVECGTIRGWVWDRGKPNTPLTVEFYHNVTKEVYGSTVANISRQDLKDAGKGNGVHGYSLTVPDGLKDGVSRPIMARVLGSTYALKGGPKVLTCNSPVRLSAETSSPLQVTVLGNPVSDQIELEVRGAEGQPIRLQLTDASGRLISQRQIEAAKAVERQSLSVGQQPAGLLFLRVINGLKSVTVKVIRK